MDRFAAQIASVDAVVSISNTAAHLAGALSVPTIVILEDRLRNWPVFSDRVPWYPTVRLVRRNGREWTEVMQEVRTLLETVLEDRKAKVRGDV
jgi:ADP-heptose:LPS heptosyltransferase